VQYFPYEMIHSAAPGSAYIQIAPGQVLNGMIQMPSLLLPSDYARQVMFRMARPGASNVKWHRPVELESLASAWFKALHANDPVKPSIKKRSVEVDYQQDGAAYKEVWTVLNTSTRVAQDQIRKMDQAIQKQEHNTLMGVDEYRDPETDRRALLDFTYRYNNTNVENIIQTNDGSLKPPSEYRKMTRQ
jgi:hypothetical protein